MKRNELLIQYPWSTGEKGYHIRVYDSVVEFRHRDFFAHRHADFEISCVLCGQGLYCLRDGAVTIGAGDVFVFGSNQVHCITENDPDDPITLFNVQFEPRMLWSPTIGLARRSYLPLFRGKCERLAGNEDLLRAVCAKLGVLRQESIERTAGYDIMIRACLDEILTLLMRASPLSASAGGQCDRRENLFGMERAMAYIDAHLDAPMTLFEIAAYCGFSRTYFSTLFKALNGLTPWEHITLRRIDKSVALLLSTDLSVLEIAGRCGYDNLSNFNRMFVRAMGTSPAAYRKKKRGENEI